MPAKVRTGSLTELLKTARDDDALLDEGGGEWLLGYIRSSEGQEIGWQEYMQSIFTRQPATHHPYLVPESGGRIIARLDKVTDNVPERFYLVRARKQQGKPTEEDTNKQDDEN